MCTQPREPASPAPWGHAASCVPKTVTLQQATEVSVDTACAAQTPLQDRGCTRGKGRTLHLNQVLGLTPEAAGGSAGSPSQRVVSLVEAPTWPGPRATHCPPPPEGLGHRGRGRRMPENSCISPQGCEVWVLSCPWEGHKSSRPPPDLSLITRAPEADLGAWLHKRALEGDPGLRCPGEARSGFPLTRAS